MSKLSSTVGRTFKSTNFTVQSLIPLVTALFLLVGIPEDMTTQIISFVTATVTTGVGFWGFFRELFKDGISLDWSSNVLTYIVAFFTGLFPFLEGYDIVPAIENLIAGISAGDFSLIFAAVFVIGNIIYQIVQSRPTDIDTDSEEGPLRGATLA